jgi:hemolysin activation/secretion protein
MAAGFAIALVGGLAGVRAPAQTAPQAQTPAQTQATREALNPLARTEQSMRRGQGDLFTGPLPESCPLPPMTSAYALRDVRVDGAAGLGDAETRALWADLADRPITTAGICDLRDRLAARLFKKGILARVLIPGQRADGVVRLTVVEAQIAAVRFHGDVGPARARVEAILDHLVGLAPFRLDTAQRYLLLANDVPGVVAVARFSQSTAPGASSGSLDLDIDLGRTPVEALVETQNVNGAGYGPWTGIARVDFNGLTPLGDRTSLIADTTLGAQSQTVAQVIESARIGANGVFTQASFAYGHTHPGGGLPDLALRGDSYVGTLEIDDPVIRLKRLNLTLAGGLDIVDQTNDSVGAGVLADDALRVFWLRAIVGARRNFTRPILGGHVSAAADATVDLRQGADILGASAPGAATLSRPAGRSDAFVVREDSTFALRFQPAAWPDAPFTLAVHTQAQWADKPLLAYEEQAIGNLTIGRGYDPDAVSGDRAIAADIKAEAGPLPISAWLRAPAAFSLGPYGFYDIASVETLDGGAPAATLRSVGGGLEILVPYTARGRAGVVHADVAYAVPLDRVSPFAAARPPSRVLFTLVVTH